MPFLSIISSISLVVFANTSYEDRLFGAGKTIVG